VLFPIQKTKSAPS